MDEAGLTLSAYRLPPVLEPWRDSLELFPENLREAMGVWLPRIASALGSLSRYQEVNNGEPDGFSGIAQRGPYERLLMTEWALAELYPDEFLRRAVMGEQSFYQLAYQEPSASKRISVLLDSGPEQLGGPRLVQLALLIVIASRAERAEIELEWGILQERTIHKGVSRTSIQAFLQSRSHRSPGEGDFEAWSDILASSALDESWTIGGANAIELARERGTSSLVRLDDPLDPETACVCIEFLRGVSVGTTLRLNIPPAPDAVRLVRDPFGDRPSASSEHSVVLSTTPRLCFSKQRHRLLALTDSGSLVAFHVPGSSGCKPGRPKHVRREEGETFVAAQVRGRRISTMSICHATGELVMRGVFGDRNQEALRFSSEIETENEPVIFSHPKKSDPLSTIDFDFRLGPSDEYNNHPVVLDAAGNLFCWNTSYPSRQPECIATNVIAIWPTHARYARVDEDGLSMVHHHARMMRDREEPKGAGGPNVIAVDASGEPGMTCYVTKQTDKEVFWVAPQVMASITLQTGDTVCGIASHKGQRGVIVLDETRSSIYFTLPSQRRLVVRLAGKARDTVLSPTGSHLAALSAEGHLQVYSFERDALVLNDQVGVAS